jgi:hypothetical protein
MVHGANMQEFLEDRTLLEKELGMYYMKYVKVSFLKFNKFNPPFL